MVIIEAGQRKLGDVLVNNMPFDGVTLTRPISLKRSLKKQVSVAKAIKNKQKKFLLKKIRQR